MKNLISAILMSIGLLVTGATTAEQAPNLENQLVTICKVIKENNQARLRREVNAIHLRYLSGEIGYQQVVKSFTCHSYSALEYALHLNAMESAQLLADMVKVDLNEYISQQNIQYEAALN